MPLDSTNVTGDAAPWKLDWASAATPGSTPASSSAPPPPSQDAPWNLNWGTQDAQDTSPPASQAPTDQAADQAQVSASQDVTASVPELSGYDPNDPSQIVSSPSTGVVGGGVGSLVAGLGQGAVTGAGSALAGPGHIITGATAALGHGVEQAAINRLQEAQAQIGIMDRIDRGEAVPAEQDPLGYQNLDPAQRAQLRATYTQQLAQMPPPEQTDLYQAGKGIAAGGKAVGETIAVPGDWINVQGQKITPPEGYENSLSNLTGKALGTIPMFLASLWAGGMPALVGVAGSQTFTDKFNDDIKHGVAPEDAAANAGLTALTAAGLMTLPVARWAETLQGVAKQAFVATATRAAADGAIMTSVSQAQQLINNVIDKATIAKDRSLTEGVGDPNEMIAQFVAGMVPGAVGAAAGKVLGLSDRSVRSTGGPEGADQASPGVAAGPAPGAPEKRGGEPGAAAGPVPGAAPALSETPRPEAEVQAETSVEAPAPDSEKVAPGITTPPSQDAGGTLVRATDSSGQSWVGHGGVLVAEGRNQAVDNVFRDAEQHQPLTSYEHDDTKDIDRLVATANTHATNRVTWTGTAEAPDGRAVVQGRDAVTGRMIEIPEERYAVLAQYGDPARDMYVDARPGDAPVVAVREPASVVPGQAPRVLAIAQARPRLEEPESSGAPGPTLEERDQALANNQPPPLPPEAVPLQAQLDRINRNGPPTPGTPLADQAARLEKRIGELVDASYTQANLSGTTEEGPEPPEADAALAARLPRTRVPRTQRQPDITPPDITDRPSLYRQAFRDAGYDPDVMVNRPIGEQQNVLADHIGRTFGFKVTVDPKMQPQKAVDSMLDGYRNMQWMAHALGYPLKAMSLNGKVGLNLEPLKSQGAYLGLYRGATRAIHMPDRSNSFAHEWTHALDHELLSRLAIDPQARGMLASSRGTNGGLDINASPPGNATEAFAHVLRAIFHDHASEALRLAQLNAKAQGKGPAAQAAAAEAQRIVAGAKSRMIEGTEYAKAAKKRDPYRRYWAMPEEMLARAHEAYVAHQVAQAGGTNEFITKGDVNYLGNSVRRFIELYPQGSDRDAIFRAFQDLHAAMLREQTLGRGAAAQRPGDYDMLDPVHWRNISNLTANPQMVAALRQSMQRNTTWRQRLLQDIRDRAGIGTRVTSTTSAMHIAQHAKDEATAYMWGAMGQLETYRDRYKGEGNHGGAKLIDNLISLLGWRYGENMWQATPFERRARNYANVQVNRVDRAMEANGVSPSRTNEEQETQWWRALRGRDTAGIPANIMRLAAENRAQLQNAWYDLERAGIPVGMPRDEGYVPIMYDEAKMLDDPGAARDTIHTAMSKDFDVKHAADPGFIHDAYGEIPRRNLPRDVHDAMAQLAQVHEELRVESAKLLPDQAKLADLSRQQTNLLKKVVDPVREAWAQLHADNWMHALDDVKWNDKAAGAGPVSSPFKSRVLSAEARDILEPYIITRPSELLSHYFHTVGRKIAAAERFGTRFQVLDKMMNDLADAGVRKEERQGIAQVIQASLGLLNNKGVTLGSHGSTWARAISTMVLMGRAGLSSIGEPLVTAWHTDDIRPAIKGFGTMVQALLHDINLTKGSDRIQHLSDIANVLGITSSRLQEAMLMGRTETLLSNVSGRVMANFYRRIGLTQITNANKQGAIQGAHTAMQLWARQILQGKRGALFNPHGEYRELGIPDAEHEAFARWIVDHHDLPTMQEITDTAMGQRWSEAVKRFVDKVVLEPTAAEKPIHAGSAIGRFVYGLMSYNYLFQRAVLNPAMERRIHAIHDEQGRLGRVGGYASGNLKWALHTSMALSAMLAVGIPMTIVRQEIFDHDRVKQWRQEGTYWDHILGLAMQRTGVGGIADPVVNAFNGLKYDHDLSSLVLGAQGNFYVQALKDLTGRFMGASSPDTNTANYRMARGFYELFGMPTAALATAMLPGGPLKSWGLSLMGQFLTSSTAGDVFARTVVGPKGKNPNLSPMERELAQANKQLDDAEAAQDVPDFDDQGNIIYPHQKKSGTQPPSGLLSLADDFLVPALKNTGRLAGRLAGRVARMIR